MFKGSRTLLLRASPSTIHAHTHTTCLAPSRFHTSRARAHTHSVTHTPQTNFSGIWTREDSTGSRVREMQPESGSRRQRVESGPGCETAPPLGASPPFPSAPYPLPCVWMIPHCARVCVCGCVCARLSATFCNTADATTQKSSLPSPFPVHARREASYPSPHNANFLSTNHPTNEKHTHTPHTMSTRNTKKNPSRK